MSAMELRDSAVVRRPIPEEDVRTWKDRALCHGLSAIFDLEESAGITKIPVIRSRAENKARLQVARELCDDCPVFQECWNDAWENDAVGVIRAGTALGSDVLAIRRKRLMMTKKRREAQK